MSKIDIHNRFYYEFDKPEKALRTQKRLTEIDVLGLQDIGGDQFGIKDLMSGLYIEMVWNHSDQEWDRYIFWVTSLIEEAEQKEENSLPDVCKQCGWEKCDCLTDNDE
jgi:hypothetical protein